VIRNDRKKGGAVRPWEWIAVNPMSSNIVGRKTEVTATCQHEHPSCHILKGAQYLAETRSRHSY